MRHKYQRWLLFFKIKRMWRNFFKQYSPRTRVPSFPILILDDGSSHYDKGWTVEQWANFWDNQVTSKHKQYLKRLAKARSNYKKVTGQERDY